MTSFYLHLALPFRNMPPVSASRRCTLKEGIPCRAPSLRSRPGVAQSARPAAKTPSRPYACPCPQESHPSRCRRLGCGRPLRTCPFPVKWRGLGGGGRRGVGLAGPPRPPQPPCGCWGLVCGGGTPTTAKFCPKVNESPVTCNTWAGLLRMHMRKFFHLLMPHDTRSSGSGSPGGHFVFFRPSMLVQPLFEIHGKVQRMHRKVGRPMRRRLVVTSVMRSLHSSACRENSSGGGNRSGQASGRQKYPEVEPGDWGALDETVPHQSAPTASAPPPSQLATAPTPAPTPALPPRVITPGDWGAVEDLIVEQPQPAPVSALPRMQPPPPEAFQPPSTGQQPPHTGNGVHVAAGDWGALDQSVVHQPVSPPPNPTPPSKPQTHPLLSLPPAVSSAFAPLEYVVGRCIYKTRHCTLPLAKPANLTYAPVTPLPHPLQAQVLKVYPPVA